MKIQEFCLCIYQGTVLPSCIVVIQGSHHGDSEHSWQQLNLVTEGFIALPLTETRAEPTNAMTRNEIYKTFCPRESWWIGRDINVTWISPASVKGSASPKSLIELQRWPIEILRAGKYCSGFRLFFWWFLLLRLCIFVLGFECTFVLGCFRSAGRLIRWL